MSSILLPKLAIVYSEALKTVYREELELRLGQADTARTLGAWPLVVQLIEKGLDWAVDLGSDRWPNDTSASNAIVSQMPADSLRTPWMWQKVEEMVWSQSPAQALRVLDDFAFTEEERENSSDPIVMIGAWRYWRNGVAVKTVNEGSGELRISLTPAFRRDKNSGFFEALTRVPRSHPGWLPFILANQFLDSPNAQTLSKIQSIARMQTLSIPVWRT